MNLSELFLRLYAYQIIPLNIILNSILVYKDIRNGFLIEIGYKNYKEILDILEKNYPNFKFVEMISKENSYQTTYGTLVVKKDYVLPSKPYDISHLITAESHKELGDILSYPCSGDMDLKNQRFLFSIHVEYLKKPEQLIGMICSKKRSISELEKFIKKIKNCIDEINKNITDPIDLWSDFEKMDIYDDVIKQYIADQIDDELIKYINNMFNNVFPILIFLQRDKIFDIKDKKFKQLIIFLLNLATVNNMAFDILMSEPKEQVKQNEEYKEVEYSNAYENTKLIIKLFHDLYNIKIDDKYMKMTEEYVRERLDNLH